MKVSEMDAKGTELGVYVDAAAALIGIVVAPEWRAGVSYHLGIILANAELVAEAACAAESEPAPVYRLESADGRAR